jgi:hypothetical protein
MKAAALTLVFVVTAVPFAVAGEVSPGDSWAEVKATLGTPKGQVQRDGRQILYYERGSVEMVSGQVATVSLRSPEEQAALMAREEVQRAEREAIRDRLNAEGIALRDRKLADTNFLSAPLAYQVSFWETFARSYPGVPCGEPLIIARMRYNEQLAEKSRREAEAERRAEQEERLAAAERDNTVYPIRRFVSYRGHFHHSRDTGLGPITYHFNDTGLTPYSTPVGNPAGSLTGPVVDGLYQNALRDDPYDRVDSMRQDANEGERMGRSGDRGRSRGWDHQRRDRM